ncbi:AraC family transcriptional regulator [Raoultella sp. WB_B2P2-3]|jgi:AraC-like DNA-binding protein|uniref:AraC family transcriptional regulator n=1 Tax=Raoultella scottii TaxID=3040937 RepID=A0ABU8Z0G0_9ENTR|nr:MULTISPECIES: AraC family transcriptional regulator [Enterobacteriaceae]MVT05798.1 helix-turn-helix domain-containing protein [Raoultella sp. 10-1]PAC08227.1 AraC family transcriptional regulator [Enterobacter sp. 10-1]
MTNHHAATPSAQSFLVEDFLDFGERYGIDYRFPALSSRYSSDKDRRIVVRGSVEEMLLPSGIRLTHSHVQVMQPYESTSLRSSPMYTLIILEGCLRIRLGERYFIVRPGMALTTRLGEQWVMNVSHLADTQLKTIVLGFSPETLQLLPAMTELLFEWGQMKCPCYLWSVPEYLLAGIHAALASNSPLITRQLMLNGVAMQVLGHAMTAECPVSPLFSPGEWGRLESVRQRLEQQPQQEHTLCELARNAAMSPSSLSAKFRQAYGDSVFDYLRDCRLALAYHHLQQGYSVQQAAWMSGYQHATNFATAFRRRYGIAPSAVRNS